MTSELAARSEAFACEVSELIRGSLGVDVQVVSVRLGDRYAIRPAGDTAPQRRIPLCVNGQHLADLSLALYQTFDHSRRHLKTTRMDFGIFSTLDRTPLLRLEYRSDMREDPWSATGRSTQSEVPSPTSCRSPTQRTRAEYPVRTTCRRSTCPSVANASGPASRT
ncbi:hypothetical protein [Cellulomonas sp. PS-H5]|uniref:hypothetical protein n=1 Tax=Cellulomonas sp. PS-H5 TaxID=2820400 RepID=UPI001C4E4E3E|nr:hypothetical protein [Cellulomonas sp. PS-H5]MBW0253696.1 hypothetical protein [Cellulomonas sp. PS-H5]